MEKIIYVASGSNSRKELAQNRGLDWKFVPNEFDEEGIKHLFAIEKFDDAIDYTKALSYGKAMSVVGKHEGIVIGCDSVVYLNGKILEKPKDENEFEMMMDLLSSKPHYLITGVAIIDSITRKTVRFAEVTKLAFDKFSNEQKVFLLKNKNGLNNAGGYTLCNEIDDKTHIIKGNRDNVIGLPIKRILEELKNFN